MKTFDQNQLMETLKEVLEKQSSFQELTKQDIENHIEKFIQAGINGAITNREWSPRYAEMQRYYLKKYLSDATPKFKPFILS